MLTTAGLAVPAAAAPEGQMTWAIHVTLAPKWLDPGETEAVATPFMVLYPLHDALVKLGPGGMMPSLAESWTVSPDGINYDLVLRNGIKFHNGEPVTAEDVKFSFERYRGGSAKVLKDKVKEVQVVDPPPGADRPQGALAGLHDLLRHHGDGCRLDRAEEIRREGR